MSTDLATPLVKSLTIRYGPTKTDSLFASEFVVGDRTELAYILKGMDIHILPDLGPC